MLISLLLPLMVSAVGIFLLFKLKFFFLTHPIKTAKEILHLLKDRGARRAFCLALAGTLGVGNIFGVAAGIMLGGPGSLFWLFISSIFAMAIKYAETLLVFDNPNKKGGTSGSILNSFPKTGKMLSLIYAGLTILLSLTMGSTMQTYAVVDTAHSALGLSPIFTTAIVLILLLPLIGIFKLKIESVTEIIIPMSTIIYIIMLFSVIFMNFNKLSDVFILIISSAFTLKSTIFGSVFGISLVALREGFARGILSNEAGCGTSALGHSRAENNSPRSAGLFGICEVFFDTTVLCSLTGLVILLAVDDVSLFSSPMSLVTYAFVRYLGDFSGLILLILIFAFAYSTIICWFSYGKEMISLYFPKLEKLFAPIFALTVLLCCYIPHILLISFTDVILFIMAIITLSVILKKTERILELTSVK